MSPEERRFFRLQIALAPQVVEDAEALADRAARTLASVLRRKKSAIVALPTGRTPLRLYERLAILRSEGLDTQRMRIVSVDEYLGVGPEDPVSLFGWLSRVALAPLGVTEDRVFRVPAEAQDLARKCRAFDRDLERRGGLDLAVLGLGWNGHVAFNEPGARATSPTRAVDLAAGTLERNRRYWGGSRELPARAVTLGMRAILGARRILLLASGSEKAVALALALRGPVTPRVPASLLRLGRLTVIADRSAASRLSHVD